MAKPSDLLLDMSGEVHQDVESAGYHYHVAAEEARPRFHRDWIPWMLRDQRIQFALWMIKGPILSKTRFFIDDPRSNGEDHSPLKKFLIRQITRYWRYSAIKALRAVEWGYAGAEVYYRPRRDRNEIEFHTLKPLNPFQVRPVTLRGRKVGMAYRHPSRNDNSPSGNLYIGGPKSLWTVHSREEGSWYGQSRLFGAFDPWMDLHLPLIGLKSIRRLYFAKYSINGDVLYHPPGTAPNPDDPNGPEIRWRDVAREVLDARKSGGTMTLPNQVVNGVRQWEYIPASAGPANVAITEQHRDLRDEMSEGMGVPTEVIHAATTGSGYSGRRVPEEAFMAILQEIANWVIFDFDEQCLRALAHYNGFRDDYEIVPFGLVRGSQAAEDAELPQPPDSAEPDTSGQPSQFSLCV